MMYAQGHSQLARYARGATATPPSLLNQADLGEADRENLSSPYATWRSELSA